MSFLEEIIEKLEAFADRYGKPLGYNVLLKGPDKNDASDMDLSVLPAP
jgi:hypothetical protein